MSLPANLRALTLALVMASCNSSSDRAASSTSSPTPEGPAASAPETAASPAADSARPKTPAAHPYAGSWSGGFKAVKAEVFVPGGVAKQVWSDDDGSSATGDGKISLTISPKGRIRGKTTGSLGALTVTGQVEGESLRAGLSPTDPLAEPFVMKGILVGQSKGKDVFSTTLRVSSQDAKLVRQAELTLKRE